MVLKQESMRGFFFLYARTKKSGRCREVAAWGWRLVEVGLYYSKFISSYDEYIFFNLYPCSSVETGMN